MVPIALIFAIVYAQFINAVEALLWVKGLWVLKAPFKFETKEVYRDLYHVLLALLYIAPFLPLGLLETIRLAWIVWILNDTTWHFWAVKPSDWIKWIKFYFNPFKNEVVWYARLGIIQVKVTPKRMFYITLIRILVLPFLLLL
mgnify:CR=1 FL=1